MNLEEGPWIRALESLQLARESVNQEDQEAAVVVAMRTAAVDTGAIEGLYTTDRGFTMSVAEGAIAMEAANTEKGDDFQALFEGQLFAFEMALDVATGQQEISESWLRQLHQATTSGQATYRVRTSAGQQDHPLTGGEYKRYPNHVMTTTGIHAYCPVDLVPDEVRVLVEELRTDAFISANPAIQAAYAHYALVRIHPFADGNGRIARIMMNAELLAHDEERIIIPTAYRTDYLSALKRSRIRTKLQKLQRERQRA